MKIKDVRIKLMTASAGLLLAMMTLAILPAAPTARVAARRVMTDQDFLQRVSNDHAIPVERLQVGSRVSQDYRYSGLHVEAAKVIDNATGEVYGVEVDGSGYPTSLAAAESAEAAATAALFGKIDPALHARLSGMGDGDRLLVSIWLNIPDPPFGRASEEDQAARDEEVSRFMAPLRQPVLNAIAGLGAHATAPRYAPAVFAELTRSQIEVISRRDDVDVIYGPEDYIEMGDDAGTTNRVNAVWQSGNLGSGPLQIITVKPVNLSTGAADPTNTYLNNATHPVEYFNPSGMVVGAHATQTTGVIASTHSLYRGTAPLCKVILNANSGGHPSLSGDAARVAAYEWAHDEGGDPVNFSFGACTYTHTFLSRYMDWATKNLADTFVISAGNAGKCSNDERVKSPAFAWTVIAVGNHRDQSNGWWSDDVMAEGSCWKNPGFASGMEKPEVVAVGTSVKTTTLGAEGLATVNGTSFSAPQVAGQIALMLARKPLQKQWPETNKAAVLASAFRNIEGVTGDTKDFDERDGVGGIVINNGDDTYLFGHYINDTPSDGPLELDEFPRTYNDVLSLTAGERVRVAMAYDSWSTGANGTNKLGADLDLYVTGPGGLSVKSDSFQNAWEMVDFVAPVTGTYDISVKLYSSDPGWPGTYLGIAWSIMSIPNFCTGAISVPETGGTFYVATANGPTFFDSYSGWGASQKAREKVLKLVLSTTKDITVTDTDPDLDLHVVQLPSESPIACAADPVNLIIKGQGANSVFINNAPAGTYYIIVDGAVVDNTNVTVTVSN